MAMTDVAMPSVSRRAVLEEGVTATGALARVEYDAQKLRALADEIIDYAVRVVADSKLAGEEAEFYWEHVANFLLQSLMRFKNPAFREEREWRLICLSAPQLVRFRVVGTRLVPYFELRFSLDAIRTIRLGPRYSSRDNRVVRSFLSSVGLDGVRSRKLHRASVLINSRAALEIKGFEDNQTKAKHTAGKRWGEAVNNWGPLGAWSFYICQNHQLLDKEMEYLATERICAVRPGSQLCLPRRTVGQPWTSAFPAMPNGK